MQKKEKDSFRLGLKHLEHSLHFDRGAYAEDVNGTIMKLGIPILHMVRYALPEGGVTEPGRVARALNALDAWERLISSPTMAARNCKCDTCKKHIPNPEDVTPVARISVRCRECSGK